MPDVTRLSFFIVASLVLNHAIVFDMEHPDTPDLMFWAVEAAQNAILKALPEMDMVSISQLHDKLKYPTLH